MDYSQAKEIRGKSLSGMVLDKMASGGGIGSSIGTTISEKLKAKATGIKEKFDPMNMVKFATGGSKLATGIFGKMTGRSQKDIDHFTGRKPVEAKASRLPESSGDKLGGSATQILTEIYDFMVKSHDEDKQIREIERAFDEEKENEKQRRHAEFVEKLKEFVDYKSQPEIKVIGQKEPALLPGIYSEMKDKLAGFATGIKNMFSSIVSFVEGLFKYLADTVIVGMLATFFRKITGWLTGGLGKLLLELLSPANFLKLMSKALGVGGKILSAIFAFLRNPIVLGILAAVAATWAAVKLAKDTDMQFQGRIEFHDKEIQKQLAFLQALDDLPDSKKFNPDGTPNQDWLSRRQNTLNRLAKEEKELAVVMDEFKQKQALEEYKDKYGGEDFNVYKQIQEYRNAVEEEKDTEDLLEKIRRNLPTDLNQNDIDQFKNNTRELIQNAPKLNSDLDNPTSPLNIFHGVQEQNHSLNLTNNYGEQYAGVADIINQTTTTKPKVNKKESPATASVRDDTQIFNRVFNQSTVAV